MGVRSALERAQLANQIGKMRANLSSENATLYVDVPIEYAETLRHTHADSLPPLPPLVCDILFAIALACKTRPALLLPSCRVAPSLTSATPSVRVRLVFALLCSC